MFYFCHHIFLCFSICHHISLSIAIRHHISLSIAIRHHISLYIIIYFYITLYVSLPFIICCCLPLCFITYLYIPFRIFICYCISSHPTYLEKIIAGNSLLQKNKNPPKHSSVKILCFNGFVSRILFN